MNSTTQHRVKHFDLLLARELSLLEREHSHNLIIHQKLENSIRRANNQSTSNSRNKLSIPFDNIYNEQAESIDYHKIHRTTDSNQSNQRRLLSNGVSSTISQNQTVIDQTDAFSDDSSSFSLFRRRRVCTKHQRLPPIVKANILTRQRRDSKNRHWMTNIQQSNIRKDDRSEPFTMLNEEASKPNLPELTPIQRQVRSFLETLPTYKGVQHGFDSFAPASLYSNRAPVAIQ